jgi:hypothetical protein
MKERAASVWLAIVGCCVALVGCGASPAAELRVKAAQDLRCAPEKLELIALDPKPFVSGEAADWATTVAVSGCGSKSNYTRANGVWVGSSNDPPPVLP